MKYNYFFICLIFELFSVSCSMASSKIKIKYEDRPVLGVIDILGYDYSMYFNDDNQKSMRINSDEIANLLREKFSHMERDTTMKHFVGYDVYAKLVCEIEGYGYDVLVVNKFDEDCYLLELNGKCMVMDKDLLHFVTELISYHKVSKYPSVIKEDIAKKFWKN